MLDTDDPDHRRLRALVNKAFSRRHLETIKPRIDEIASELLSKLERGGTVDLRGKWRRGKAGGDWMPESDEPVELPEHPLIDGLDSHTDQEVSSAL